MFYGFVAIISVGLLYAYRNALRANMYLLYGFGGLFLMGLGIRAVQSARPGLSRSALGDDRAGQRA